MLRDAFLLPLTILLLIVVPAEAQKNSVEFGVDLGVTVTTVDDSDLTLVDVGIPAPRLRVGAFVSDQVSFETSVGFSLLDVDDVTTTSTQLALGVVVHSTPDYLDLRFYTAPFGAVSILHIDETVAQWSIGALIGLKGPIRDTFLGRVEVSYARAFENDDLAGSNNIRGVAGLSFLVL